MELNITPTSNQSPSLIMQQYSKAMFFSLSFTLSIIAFLNMFNDPANEMIILICVLQCGILIQSLIRYRVACWRNCSNIYAVGLIISCIFHLPEQNFMCICASSYVLGRILNYHYIMGRMKISFEVHIVSIILAHLYTGGCPIALFPIIYGIFHCSFLSDVIYKANVDMSDKLEELLKQDKHKDTCFAALIHELRNPLTTYSIQ
jgi:hypothetical protein